MQSKTPVAPAKAATKPLGRNGFKYKQQFGIVVVCDDEPAQAKAYARLQRAGFKRLKVVTV
ncbi:hypothetical protein EM864_12390 [Stenotrophomonas acidaminiphila]|uniref:hypothetical protein n=1 Tax=Stenotrophomonas acidaminiphila TaxID=128780 RepID=UPI0024060335|nr:hypothetical protein [Stenotrophomonas acidaminiphila]MDF9442544.1 hypothetical protein [Stenotrophomonas acidaminiphila]